MSYTVYEWVPTLTANVYSEGFSLRLDTLSYVERISDEFKLVVKLVVWYSETWGC